MADESGQKPALVPPTERERHRLQALELRIAATPRPRETQAQPWNPPLLAQITAEGRITCSLTVWGVNELRLIGTAWLQHFTPFGDAGDMSSEWVADYFPAGVVPRFFQSGHNVYAWMSGKGWAAPAPEEWGWHEGRGALLGVPADEDEVPF